MKLLNAFSLSMLAEMPATVEIFEIDTWRAAEAMALSMESYVGHADTAAVFAEELGLPVSVNRASVTLRPGEEAVVGQYIGPRLPEGTATLPEGATIRWMLVSVLELTP